VKNAREEGEDAKTPENTGDFEDGGDERRPTD
jgi:hypothetical protein